MASTPDDDDEATVRVAAAADDESTRVLTKSSAVPAPVPPALFVAQANDVDPEATNINPFAAADAKVKAKAVRRLVRRFTGELKIRVAREKPGFLFFSLVAILVICLLVGAVRLAAWAFGSGDDRVAQARQEERGVLDRLTNW